MNWYLVALDERLAGARENIRTLLSDQMAHLHVKETRVEANMRIDYLSKLLAYFSPNRAMTQLGILVVCYDKIPSHRRFDPQAAIDLEKWVSLNICSPVSKQLWPQMQNFGALSVRLPHNLTFTSYTDLAGFLPRNETYQPNRDFSILWAEKPANVVSEENKMIEAMVRLIVWRKPDENSATGREVFLGITPRDETANSEICFQAGVKRSTKKIDWHLCDNQGYVVFPNVNWQHKEILIELRGSFQTSVELFL